MIATQEQIKDIIVNNPNRALVDTAVKNHKKLRMHLYGDNLQDYIKAIDGFEDERMMKVRKKYAKSNKAMFARIGRNMDKIFTARGRSIYYNLTDAANKIAMRYCNDVRNGLSASQWVEKYWKDLLKSDPTGCIFMEVGVGEIYPTYKCSSSYYDFEAKGSGFEYLAFEVTNTEKRAAGIDEKLRVYRFVDDAFDYYVKRVDDSIEILKEHTFPNYLQSVPAIVNSDITDPLNDGLALSLFHEVMEDADEYLLKGSIKMLHEFRHGYPKYWEFADDCAKCGGTKVYDGKDCTACNGSGKSLMLSPSVAKALNWPQTKDDPNVAPNVAGYVEPSEIYHNIATTGLTMLESYIHYTIWGNYPAVQTTGMNADKNGDVKTATQVVSDLQPEIDRLQSLSTMAEKRIKFIIDNIVKFQLRENYGGASVNLGRRYLMESSDELWKRYVDAKDSGADDSLLDELYQEFIETKYASDPNGMDIMLKVRLVVPFFHWTADEVRSAGVSEEVYKQKLFAGEWQKSVEDVYLLITPVEQLRKDLIDYCSKMTLQQDPNNQQQPGGKIGFNQN